MIKDTITINNQEVPVMFNLGTILNYEDVTGKSFFGEKFENTKMRIALIFAAIYSADKDSNIKMDDILAIEDWQELQAAFAKVLNLAVTFLHIPDVVVEAEKKDAENLVEQKEGDEPKN